jgi:selenocysteine lyase/cysteine desulfurase
MYYFDNAATTFPKPPPVLTSMRRAMSEYGGNPGRAGHGLSIKTAQAVFEAREKCAEFFGAEIEHTIFTLNCTHALNMAIKGIAVPNCHYIMSDLEHNACARPVHAVSKANGITYSVAKTFDDDEQTVKSFESLINVGTRAVVCTAASNVTGKILPFKRIGNMCRRKGICFILDAAQGGGVVDIRLSDGVNFICCSGHKGLYGPIIFAQQGSSNPVFMRVQFLRFLYPSVYICTTAFFGHFYAVSFCVFVSIKSKIR